MTAHKRKHRSQWPSNFVTKKKKYLKIPLKLLRQIGGKHKLRKRKNVKLRKRNKC